MISSSYISLLYKLCVTKLKLTCVLHIIYCPNFIKKKYGTHGLKYTLMSLQ